MTPAQIAAKGSEHAHQAAFFAFMGIAHKYGWSAAEDERSYTEYGHLSRTYGANPRQEPTPNGKGQRWTDDGGRDPVPELRWLHAIPNGGRRDGFTAALMVAEGVRKGIVDICLPLPCRFAGGDVRYCGFYLEMKRAKSKGKVAGKLSVDQGEFVGYARAVGYAVAVCFNWQDAVAQVRSYIEEVRKGKV